MGEPIRLGSATARLLTTGHKGHFAVSDEACECPAEEHTCPFAEEIHDDSESLCTCCEECTHECAMDI